MKVDMFWIPQTPVGRLAIMPRPRAGDWLYDELRAWRFEGVTAVVSLLTRFEVYELNLAEEAAVCDELGLTFVPFPINDRRVPHSVPLARQLVATLHDMLQAGGGVAIHCRMGIGRSAMIAAAVLKQQGIPTDLAFSLVEQARGRPVPDTAEQIEWVRQLKL